MRKADSRLVDLYKDLAEHGRPDMKFAIKNMQLYLQHHPNWDIESTKKRILRDALLLYHALEQVH